MTVLCDGRRISQEMMRPTILARSRVLFRPVLSNSVPRVQAVEASRRQAQNRLPRIGISSHRLARCAASEATASWGPYLTSLVDKCSALDSHMKALSEEQRVAVYDNEKVVRVIAGPGSGKTRVLTARVALLLLSGIKPENFLILTFTNKASKELKGRLTNVMGEEEFNDLLKYMWIGTFHAMASKILRREIEHLKLGYRRNYTILDTDDTHRVVYEILMKTVVLFEIPEGASPEDKKAIRRLNSDTKLRVRQKAKKYGSWILKVKDIVPDIHKLNPSEIHGQAGNIPIPRLEFSRIYAAYHRVTRRKNTLDFGDMISLSYALLDKNPKIRQKYLSKFQHILVDEVQDTDNCQYRLLKLLASAQRAPNEPNTNSLFVVGDPNQAIYGFRGANMENMAVNLEQDFGTQMSSQNLRDNYRSVPKILRAAEAVLCENIATPLHQKLNAMRRADQGTLEVHQFDDEKRESQFVANKLKRLNMEGIAYNEMGVLFRTKSIARNLEQSCSQAGVPYRSLSGVAFWERREVKDIMCFLRFVCNPDDELAFERIVNTPSRGIGPVAYDRLKAWAEKNTEEGFPRGLVADLESEFLEAKAVNNIFEELEVNVALQDVLEKEPNKIVPEVSNGWNNLKLSKAAFRGLNCIRSLFVFVRSLATHENAVRAVRGLVLGVGYINYINEGKFGDGDPAERERNVSTLQDEAQEQFQDRPGLHHLEEFVQSAVLWSDNDTSNGDRANFATMHAAKGLEFKVVFICGFEDGLIPLSHEGSCDIAEETRLAYVAMSRAKDQLYVTHTKFRTRFSKCEVSQESRYLNQIRSHK